MHRYELGRHLLPNSFRVLHGRIEPIPEKKEETKKDQYNSNAVLTIQSATPRTQSLKLEGEPILKLPEGKEKNYEEGKIFQ